MMKLFKKLLAVAMVAVLALTVLTGCDGITSSEVPSDNTAAGYYQNLNDNAVKYGGGGVLSALPYCTAYNSKLETTSRNKLTIYLRWLNDDENRQKDDEVDTAKKRDDKIKEIENTSKAETKYESVLRYITAGTPDYNKLYESTDAYRSADTVSIIRIKNNKENGGDDKTYTVIELFKEIR